MPYKDKNKQREHSRLWVAKRRAEFFADKSCVKCGSKLDLELDHINPEEKESHNIWSWTKERREKEIAKCQVLCYSCHKEKTKIDNSSPVVHGSSGYDRFCRCPTCRDAHRRRMKERVRK